jgi:hypothetical protein
VPEFIQIVTFDCDDIDAVIEAANSVPVPEGLPRPSSIAVAQDRDRPGHYATILRFDSYEDAMKHSESEHTHERVAKFSPLMKGEPTFHNLDIIDERQP